MATIGSDLSSGRMWVDADGAVWVVGCDSGSVWVECSTQDDLEMDDLDGAGTYRLLVCQADEQQPAIIVRPNGRPYIEVKVGDELVHYVFPSIREPAERVDAT